MEPTSLRSYLNLGNLLVKMSNYTQAEFVYRQVILLPRILPPRACTFSFRFPYDLHYTFATLPQMFFAVCLRLGLLHARLFLDVNHLRTCSMFYRLPCVRCFVQRTSLAQTVYLAIRVGV